MTSLLLLLLLLLLRRQQSPQSAAEDIRTSDVLILTPDVQKDLRDKNGNRGFLVNPEREVKVKAVMEVGKAVVEMGKAVVVEEMGAAEEEMVSTDGWMDCTVVVYARVVMATVMVVLQPTMTIRVLIVTLRFLLLLRLHRRTAMAIKGTMPPTVGTAVTAAAITPSSFRPQHTVRVQPTLTQHSILQPAVHTHTYGRTIC
mmetsp:Transcript_26018/g.61758  ORF Transcript_26018/g.61758 Transcript_26018/m.61758 type:complete len:200 (+) Transcript_26018:71-670(+)